MTDVAAAIFIEDGKVLIGQRPENKSLPNLWEFPGGKLEAGETIEQCLVREISEELDVDIVVEDFFMESMYNYEHGSFCIKVFFAKILKGQSVKPLVHKKLLWVALKDLEKYEFPAADMPIVKNLMKFD